MNTLRPVIGITTSVEEDQQRLDLRYVDAIERAGGIPMLLPVVRDSATAVAVVGLVNGLLIPGGPAVTRGMIGSLPNDLEPPDPRRTRSDEWILDAFLARRGPILGICYGMQFLNARAGGTIWADVQNQMPADVHSSSRGGTFHDATVEPDTRLCAILGARQVRVNTYHVQAVDRIGDGFRAAATAPDGVVEAIESVDGRILGVQFHPERQLDSMLGIFEDLVRAAGTA